MRIALLGAGIIGEVTARDLSVWDTPDEVVIGDLDGDKAARVAAEFGFESQQVDVRDADSLDAYTRGADAVVMTDSLRWCGRGSAPRRTP